MTSYHQQDGITLYHGDCREVLAALPDESVHAVVTDPPYGLAFMGKKWDYDVPANSWGDDGHCLGRNRPDELDLVEFIGPLFELCGVAE